MKTRCIQIFLILSCFNGNAQNGKALSFKHYYGFLLPHHTDMLDMAAPTRGFEFSYSNLSTGYAHLDTVTNFSRWSIGATYIYIGNPNVNGKVFSLNLAFEATLRRARLSHSTIRLGSGIGYFTKPFRVSTNLKNRAIGSELNGCMQLAINHYLKAGPSFNLHGGLGLTHFSNGNFTKPNLGINMPSLNVGLDWIFEKQNDKTNRQNIFHLKEKYNFSVNVFVGKRQINIADSRKLVLYTFSLLKFNKINSLRRLRFGLDLFVDRTYPYTPFKPLVSYFNKPEKITEFAVKLGHEYTLGKAGFITDFGVYLYRPNSTKRRYYQLVGFSYHVSPKIYFLTLLKAHLSSADYFEWGLGYNFN